MNSVKSTFDIVTHSLTISLNIEVHPNFGINQDGTVQRAKWGACAQALAMFLDGLEEAQPEMVSVIESEISGLGKEEDEQEDGDADDTVDDDED